MAQIFNLHHIFKAPFKIIKNYSKFPHIFRSFTTSKHLTDNYEGDGKTTVTILNKEYKHLIMIDTFSNCGFRLNNGIFAIGPLVAFPRTILQWNITDVTQITPESLSLFTVLEPKLDILIIGTGDKRILPSKHTLEYLKSKKINAEILPIQQACSTFNFLNVEGRCVAGAFIPPTEVQLYQEELQIVHTCEAVSDFSIVIDKSKIRD